MDWIRLRNRSIELLATRIHLIGAIKTFSGSSRIREHQIRWNIVGNELSFISELFNLYFFKFCFSIGFERLRRGTISRKFHQVSREFHTVSRTHPKSLSLSNWLNRNGANRPLTNLLLEWFRNRPDGRLLITSVQDTKTHLVLLLYRCDDNQLDDDWSRGLDAPSVPLLFRCYHWPTGVLLLFDDFHDPAGI